MAPRNTNLCLAGLLLVFVAASTHAEYVTPGVGVDWTLDDLVAQSAGAVTGGAGTYEVHDSVRIALADRLTIAAGTVITFLDVTGTIGLEVNGALAAIGSPLARIVFTSAAATPGAWRGLDFEDTGAGSEFHLAWCEIAYADIAIDVYGADVVVENCEIHHSLDKAVDLSAADGEIRDCWLHHNQKRTFTMTLTSSPTIERCLLEHNNEQNISPYPYFNIGLQGVNSPTIRNCRIHGNGNHMSGGIAIWNASNGLIEGNLIQGCGYGILCYQTAANPTIRDNAIIDNNIHPDTLNWGFGIACNGNSAPIVTHNRIHGHWYGVATVNGGRPNLGDLTNASTDDDGLNIITGNGLGGQIYGFYNNTPLPQMAQNNFWGYFLTAEEVENCIYDQVDDPALGLVTFAPWIVEILGVGDETPAAPLLSGVCAHPNPFNPRVELSLTLARAAMTSVTVFDLAGRLLRVLHAGKLAAGEHTFAWDGTDRRGRPLPSGTFCYRIVAGGDSAVGKLMLLR